jgi:TolB-like protein/Tfp pilus assembly protein PilF
MSDIFISYSHTDSDHALSLAERLRGQGISVWIDQHGIEAASSWSKEIVQAIDTCKALVVLLSNRSIASDNVVREVSLAFEGKKSIVPVDLETVVLTPDFRYQLAGIQRAQFENFESILRSLTRLGITPAAAETAPPVILPPTPPDPLGRKTLAVLPIEDLRPDTENSWFADGLTQELIHVLSQIERLRVKDRKSVKNYDTKGKSARRMADELGVQYLLEGTVLILNRQMRITVSLIDADEGEQLWSQTFKGTMEDIFDIQEHVALEIAEALKVNLTLKERSIAERMTENMEAYERFVRAEETVINLSRDAFRQGVRLLKEAVAIDPGFATAWATLAAIHINSYFLYRRDSEVLAEAERAATTALMHDPDSALACMQMGMVAAHRRDHKAAMRFAHQALRLDPNSGVIQMWRGDMFAAIGEIDRGIEALEYAVRLCPDNVRVVWALTFLYVLHNEHELLRTLANNSLPYLERHIMLHPYDQTVRAQYAVLLAGAGRTEEACAIALELSKVLLDDPIQLVGVAIVFHMAGDVEQTINAFERVHGVGAALYTFVSPFFRPLRSHPQYGALLTRFRRDTGVLSKSGK